MSLKKLIEDSGKRTTVNYEGKDRRVKFDESFGADKVTAIKNALGDEENKKLITQKLNPSPQK